MHYWKQDQNGRMGQIYKRKLGREKKSAILEEVQTGKNVTNLQ